MRFYIKKHLGGKEAMYNKLTNEQIKYVTFCISRHPQDRFISSIDTVIQRKKTNLDNFKTNYKSYIDDMVNEHLVRQIEFIKKIRIDYVIPMDYLDKIVKLPKRNVKEGGGKSIKWISDNKIDVESVIKSYDDDLKFYLNSVENQDKCINLKPFFKK